MLLIKNAEIHSPDPQGRCDILIGGRQILRMEEGVRVARTYAEVLDARNLIAVPGFIDGHVHILGGGGEGGYATRTPELMLSDCIQGGVTTVVGCLGTDGVTRSLAGLLAKARGLEEEGLSTYLFTGHYAIPPETLTGAIERDLLFIDKFIGVGEVAISDHRSSQPTFDQLARMVGEARRGGMLSGKAGIVNFHLGDGPRGLEPLRRLLAETEVPARHFLPTHINRNPSLFEEGIAYALAGGFVDFTTSTIPAFLAAGEVKASQALGRMLAAGVDPGNITFTSDGQGSLPDFDAQGRIAGLGVARVTSLFQEARDAVQQEGVALADALRVITANPARILRLPRKGSLAPGMDADLVLLDRRDLTVRAVVAGGRLLMKNGRALVKGTFE